MAKTFEEYLNNILLVFDSIDLDNEYRKRVTVKPLYDYFQILILEVGVYLCGLNRNTLKPCHLKTRWDLTKSCLRLLEDPSKWDQTIDTLNNIRSRVEHDDYASINKTVLSSIREKATNFKDWITSIAKKYHELSAGFSFIQEFNALSSWYVGQTDWMLHLYGDKPPFSAESDYIEQGEEHPYNRLRPLRDYVQTRMHEINSLDDLKREDIKNLIDLIKGIEHLDAKESILLHYSICPKCGGKIVETEREVGGSPDNPMPTAIIYRVGCEKCDYELNRETIQI